MHWLFPTVSEKMSGKTFTMKPPTFYWQSKGCYEGIKIAPYFPWKKEKKKHPKLCGLLCCFTGLSPRLEGWGWTSQPNPSRQLLLTADPAHHSRDRSLVFAFRQIVFSGLGRRSSASLSGMLSSKSLPTAFQWVWMYLGMLKDWRAGWFPLRLL